MTDTGKFWQSFCLFLFQNTYYKKIYNINISKIQQWRNQSFLISYNKNYDTQKEIANKVCNARLKDKEDTSMQEFLAYAETPGTPAQDKSKQTTEIVTSTQTEPPNQCQEWPTSWSERNETIYHLLLSTMWLIRQLLGLERRLSE